MKLIDASSLVKAWDDYPKSLFPALWEWILSEFQQNSISMIKPNFDEVVLVSDDCAKHVANSFERIEVTDEDLVKLSQLELSIGIDGETSYSSTGVDENDLLLVAIAANKGVAVITDEAPQFTLPKSSRNFKIPAVCRMHGRALIKLL